LTRNRVLLAAVLLAAASPAFADNALDVANQARDAASAALAIAEINAARDRHAAPIATPAPPDVTARLATPPLFPTIAPPADLAKAFTPPAAQPMAPAQPFYFGKILDNPNTRALGIEGMTGR
jgi:hypothetical protein